MSISRLLADREMLRPKIMRDCASGFGPLPAGTRLVGALLLEQNDEWAVHRARRMTLESVAQTGDDASVSLTDMTG